MCKAVPGFDVRKLLKLTDRQIMCMFFPDAIPKPVKQSISVRDAFWKIGQGRGWTEAQIQHEWQRHYGS